MVLRDVLFGIHPLLLFPTPPPRGRPWDGVIQRGGPYGGTPPHEDPMGVRIVCPLHRPTSGGELGAMFASRVLLRAFSGMGGIGTVHPTAMRAGRLRRWHRWLLGNGTGGGEGAASPRRGEGLNRSIRFFGCKERRGRRSRVVHAKWFHLVLLQPFPFLWRTASFPSASVALLAVGGGGVRRRRLRLRYPSDPRGRPFSIGFGKTQVLHQPMAVLGIRRLSGFLVCVVLARRLLLGVCLVCGRCAATLTTLRLH